jgi:hypothetical protein
MRTQPTSSATPMIFKVSLAVFVLAVVVVTVLALPRDEGQARPSDAEAAALERFPRGTVQPARIEDDEWEVDIVRPDGSLVEVTFDHELNLRDVDEEIGPGGTLADDELKGAERRRAIRAAFQVTGPGDVRSVERDSPNEIEVGVRFPNGVQIEVELDRDFRVGEVEDEDPADE